MFLFFNSSFVYETCRNLQSLLNGRTISDTYKFLDSRFGENNNYFRHKPKPEMELGATNFVGAR